MRGEGQSMQCLRIRLLRGFFEVTVFTVERIHHKTIVGKEMDSLCPIDYLRFCYLYS
jgi:hypothetical protein